MHTMRKPKLGQNFLVDDAAGYWIADALGDVSGRTVVEIGPGHGAITAILAQRCRRLVLVELDRGLAAELRFRFREQPQVEVVEGDVLEVEFRALLAAGETCDAVGNLPYYITSEILLKLLAAGAEGLVERAVLMMQREVADRVVAAPGVREYGALSAAAQMHGEVHKLFTLPPTAFRPPPEVYSTVIRMVFAPRFAELGVDRVGFGRFLRMCFALKRKTLENNLRHAGYEAEQIAAAWPEGLGRMARAEAVSLPEMAELYRGLVAGIDRVSGAKSRSSASGEG